MQFKEVKENISNVHIENSLNSGISKIGRNVAYTSDCPKTYKVTSSFNGATQNIQNDMREWKVKRVETMILMPDNSRKWLFTRFCTQL